MVDMSLCLLFYVTYNKFDFSGLQSLASSSVLLKMATKSIIVLIWRGKRKIIYCSHDGYPGGLGRELVAFLLSITDADIIRFLDKLDQLEWVKTRDLVSSEALELYRQSGLAGTEDNTWYTYLRPVILQGRFLLMILTGKLKHLVDQPEAEHSVEFEYHIDFDQRLLRTNTLDRTYIHKFCELTWTTMSDIEREL